MNIEFLNLLKHHKKGIKVKKKKNRGDEPICVIIHIYMEMSQGNSLYSYLKQNIIFFSFTKSENRRAEKFLPWGGVS
jgi:hypothetical protein